MSIRLSEAAIVKAVAAEAAERITRKVIIAMQGIEDTLSGDSGLKTIWDEICVQVQYDESVFWDTYDETVRGLVSGYVSELPRHLREATRARNARPADRQFSAEPRSLMEASRTLPSAQFPVESNA